MVPWTLLAAMGLSAPADPIAERYLDALVAFERHAESIWRDAPAPADSGYFGDGASEGNGGIRGTCGVMVAYATLVRAGRGDPEPRLRRIERGLRYAAATHRTGTARCVDGKQWGHGWQTSLWCGSMAFAAKLVEDRIDPAVVAAVRRVLADEADVRSAVPPATGWQGDSKAEENGWNSNVPAMAAAWLADDPRAATWRDAAKRYLANTYTTGDRAGDPLADWLTTQTLFPSFACENHGFFHPEYQMVAGMSCGDSWAMARVAAPPVADELAPFAEHLHLPVWRCLQAVLLDTGEFAFPSGLDWALHSYGQISYLAWIACHFDDPVARWAEEKLSAALLDRQRINGDGRFTGESVPNGFYREAVCARRVAFAWWHHQLARAATGASHPPADGATHLTDVKLLTWRGPAGFVSLSYGARVMALIEPAGGYLTTPRVPGLLADARTAELERVATSADGFEAILRVRGVQPGERRLAMLCRDGLVVLIEAPSTVLAESPAAPVFPLGIENHALTGGRRTVVGEDGAHEVLERSGVTLAGLGQRVTIDHRLGLLTGPAGAFVYRAADRYNRNGAAEDQLDVLADDAAAARYLVAVPGADAAALERVAASLRWTRTADSCAVALTAPSGEPLRLGLEAPAGVALRPVAIASIAASSESAEHPARLAIDGDAGTFWVSDRGAEPGDGPTPDRPEHLELILAAAAELDGVVLFPRPSYGPRRTRLLLDGAEVWTGELGHEPRRIEFPARRAERLRLEFGSSWDPRFPASPRNVQVAEVVPLRARRAQGE